MKNCRAAATGNHILEIDSKLVHGRSNLTQHGEVFLPYALGYVGIPVNIILCSDCLFGHINRGHGVNQGEKSGFGRGQKVE